MSEKPRADGAVPPEESEEEHESWLREAVHAPQAARLPRAGELIGGKYRIEEVLGRGGMGVVFSARHAVSERPVAIKWMLRSATDEQARRRFEREARAAGRIEHPNVVSLFDIGEEGDCSYLVMELLRGESLRTRLSRGAFSPTDAVDTLIPAMRGVAAAHRAGVIHRDLKPDNIFLCQEPDGGPGSAKVLDFGISSITSLEAADSTLTQEGTLLGSIAYMSPEQLRSPHDVDGRTDVYAFGVILYELLAGGLPFQGASHSAMIVAIATSLPRRLSQVQPSVPAGLEEVAFRAFARNREDRYQDMPSLIDALLPFASVRRSGVHGDAAFQAPPRPSLPDPRVTTSSGKLAHPSVTNISVDGAALERRRSPMLWIGAAAILLLLAAWIVLGNRERAEAPAPSHASAPAATLEHPPAAPEPKAPAMPVAPEADAPPAGAPTPPAAAIATPARAPRSAPRPKSIKRPARAADETTEDAREKALFSGRK